jgi:hypothetical protein
MTAAETELPVPKLPLMVNSVEPSQAEAMDNGLMSNVQNHLQVKKFN